MMGPPRADEGGTRGRPAKDRARLERLQSEAKRNREFLASHAERSAGKGRIRKATHGQR